MKLKLDENLGKTAANIFLNAGFDAETVRGENLSGADDQQIINVCLSEKRCLVTLDLDFSNPLIYDPSLYYGIAVLRLSSHPGWEDIMTTCNTLIDGLSRQTIQGKLWIIHKNRIREYNPE